MQYNLKNSSGPPPSQDDKQGRQETHLPQLPDLPPPKAHLIQTTHDETMKTVLHSQHDNDSAIQAIINELEKKYEEENHQSQVMMFQTYIIDTDKIPYNHDDDEDSFKDIPEFMFKAYELESDDDEGR